MTPRTGGATGKPRPGPKSGRKGEKMKDIVLYPPKPAECDALCAYRLCYQWGEDKGTYVQGQGYTSYHAKPIPACMTRLMHGCPVDARVVISARMAVDITADLAERSMNARTAKDTRELNKLLKAVLNIILYIISQKGDI